MTTTSSLLDATEVNLMPGGGSAGAAEVGTAAGASPLAHAASADPAPTASAAMPPACSTERRDTAFAMSPKYSLSLLLGRAWSRRRRTGTGTSRAAARTFRGV